MVSLLNKHLLSFSVRLSLAAASLNLDNMVSCTCYFSTHHYVVQIGKYTAIFKASFSIIWFNARWKAATPFVTPKEILFRLPQMWRQYVLF